MRKKHKSKMMLVSPEFHKFAKSQAALKGKTIIDVTRDMASEPISIDEFEEKRKRKRGGLVFEPRF